ncbi:NYN domain-containing protein [Candidatus Parcubacteria bacterium]|nr:NYN domain-containing protein [Patescibacteria group bacterium]MBU4380899.1 NYN domain-containing protein [Patescibacteria group bacterium]MCG2688950.1 NYN domain-containing protein [Candidatus Parcubacteria bacterium]
MRNKNIVNYAFIDSQNLNLGIRSQGWKLDFAKFRVLLEEKYSVKKAFLFIGFIKENQDLYNLLTKSGYKLIFKPTVEYKESGYKQTKGNVDTELVLQTMIELSSFNKAIIVSGDGDFYCLIKYLLKKRKLRVVLVPNKKYSSLLREFGSFIVNIGLFKNKLKRR